MRLRAEGGVRLIATAAFASAGRRAPAERRRQTVAVLVSLLVHGLLLSLTFGGQGMGLPGFGLPWQERRAEATELRVVLVPPKRAEPSLPPALSEPARVDAPAPAPAAVMAAEPPVKKEVSTAAPPAAAVAVAEPAIAPQRMSPPADTAAPPSPRPEVVALARPAESTWVVPVTPAAPASSAQTESPVRREAVDAARERALESAEADRIKREAQQEAQQKAEQLEAARQEALRQAAARQEAARLDAARQDTDRQEAARQLAAKAEAARQDAERLEAARQAAARQQAAEAARQELAKAETARQEAARAEAARMEAERQEAARQAAARQESARQQDAARQESARQDAARQESARQDAARQEVARAAAARVEAAQAEAEKREARLRAIGQQLNAEADQRAAAARLSPPLPPSASSARRGRLFGRSDANAELVQYAEAWSRKIQLNQTFDLVRDAARQPHADPLVTVAIRSDGSVESVSFVRSSGVPAIDEAIRRIVQSQANYPAFQPALAREFDVIEIRRSWHFDMAIRLY